MKIDSPTCSAGLFQMNATNKVSAAYYNSEDFQANRGELFVDWTRFKAKKSLMQRQAVVTAVRSN